MGSASVPAPGGAGMVIEVLAAAVPLVTLTAVVRPGVVTVVFRLGVVLVTGLTGNLAGWISVAGCKTLGAKEADAGGIAAEGSVA